MTSQRLLVCIAIAIALLHFGLSHPVEAQLAVTNGGFETDAVGNNTESDQDGMSLDITDWFEGSTERYREWIRDSDDQFGGAGNNWGAMSAQTNNTPAEDSMTAVYQSVGTFEGLASFIQVSGSSSNRDNRDAFHAAIMQVGLWYDGGSATLADSVLLGDTAGLNPIGTFTVGSSDGGAVADLDGTPPDIDLNFTPNQNLGMDWSRGIDTTTSGISVGDTVYLQLRMYDGFADGRSEAYFDNISIVETDDVLMDGDTNNDGMVDIAIDFEAIRTHFLNAGASRSEGDLTGDGLVNVFDFAQWKDAFLMLGGSASAIPPLSPIPEPTSAMLVFVAGIGVALSRRRRSDTA